MKAKQGYEVKEVADVHILVPIDEELNLTGVVTLNETGLFIWNELQTEKEISDIVAAVKSEFDAPEDVISADVQEFIGMLEENGLIEK